MDSTDILGKCGPGAHIFLAYTISSDTGIAIVTHIMHAICDRLCENRPGSHLSATWYTYAGVVIRETPVTTELLLSCARPLLFNGTGLSNLLNKIQFTFEVVPCLILRRFF